MGPGTMLIYLEMNCSLSENTGEGREYALIKPRKIMVPMQSIYKYTEHSEFLQPRGHTGLGAPTQWTLSLQTYCRPRK